MQLPKVLPIILSHCFLENSIRKKLPINYVTSLPSKPESINGRDNYLILIIYKLSSMHQHKTNLLAKNI